MEYSRELDNVLIKHNDKWRGDYYLKRDMTFATDRSSAARFSLLKNDNTDIRNGDVISITSVGKTLSIGSTHDVQLHNDKYRMNSFIVSSSGKAEVITVGIPIYLISDYQAKMALKYEWQTEITMSDSSIIRHKFHDSPSLVNGYYGADMRPFEFILEYADDVDGNALTLRRRSNNINISDGYIGVAVIISLLIILISFLVIDKYYLSRH